MMIVKNSFEKYLTDVVDDIVELHLQNRYFEREQNEIHVNIPIDVHNLPIHLNQFIYSIEWHPFSFTLYDITRKNSGYSS